MADLYLHAKTMTVTIFEFLKEKEPATNEVLFAMTDLAVEKPNKISFARKYVGKGAWHTVCDGIKLYSWPTDSSNGVHIEDAPPGLMPSEFDYQVRFLMTAATLHHPEIYEVLLYMIDGARYAGIEAVNGIECHRLDLKFSHNQGDGQMWVDASGEPVLRKLVVLRMPTMDRTKPPRVGIFYYNAWTVGKKLPPDCFKFKRPKNSITGKPPSRKKQGASQSLP